MSALQKTSLIILSILLISCNQKQTKSTMKKDVHSFSNPEEVAITHMSLNLDLDFAKHTMKGYAKLNIDNKSNARKIILDTRDLSIEKILLDDKTETKFELGKFKEFMGQSLSVDITAGTKSLTVYYQTSPNAAAVQWVETEGKAAFLFTQSQAILARSWVPCQDGPGVKFTYDATIKVPQNLMALMSAENDTVKHADGVYHFKMNQPISSYLLALTVGDFEYKKIGRNSGVYAEPEMLEKAVYEFADMQKMIDAAEKLYGAYRWEQYDVVVLPASFPFGGMENPRLTFATPTIIAGDRSLVALVAHELAHSWSGNLVTNATWDDFWLNEGFTVYFENRIMEELYGKEYADMLEYLGYGELLEQVKEFGDTSVKTHLLLDMKDEDPDESVNAIAYEKGRFFLRSIEEAIGRKRWDEFVNKYFSQHAFQSMTTEDFLQYLNDELLKDDETLKQKINIDAWVFGPGIPANCPKVKATLFEEVDAAMQANGIIPTQAKTQNWNTHQWLYFLRNLPDSLSLEQMKNLDNAFGFTHSTNSEIQCDWYYHCIVNNYTVAQAFIEKFLTRVGRRKFLTPLYKAYIKTTEGKILAKQIFDKARNKYHPLAQHTVGELLN